MTNYSKILTKVVRISSLLTLSLSSIQAHAQLDKSKTYIVGTEATYAPYEYLNAKGELEGFDIDLVNYICKEIGIKCQVVNQSFEGLIPNLNYKKIDLAIAGFHPTKNRIKVVSFSDEYLPKTPNYYVVYKPAGFSSAQELKTVGTQIGTSQAAYLEQKTSYKVVKYDTNDLAYLDLAAKRIDAYLLDATVAKQTLAANSNFALLQPAVNDDIFGLSGPAIAVKKGNKDLLAAINQAIAKAKSSGYIEQLKAKYKID
ncbi:transporter substrate-binding domain-containing protein [Psittacicella hinzii]|uniref:Amino acid ABC transporter substrate-binding protein, PAAT family n=1 Tax=Psittacicella hinzii TaxID=2028575 RepID=A0A3A1YIP6_9GAMM|nr:transporter substrate-binding domain-containing protein [Psittacicella hinzii]RIY37078.1 hypothetical protein CKF58_05485 [Psittacicella hinzii]